MQSGKSKFHLIFPPILVIVLMCVFYAVYGIFPFGAKTAAWCDMNQQSIPLLMNLKDVLDGKTSIFYTFETGGGMNFWGVFLFFLASPFYLAVKFVPKQDMSYFVTVLLILKMAMCAFTASLYFSITHKSLNKKYIVLFSLIYAFCGFNLMYYQTLVWIDIVYIFPLLILSVNRLFEKNKCGLYILTLSSAVAVNYYLSFMIVIYLILSVPLYIFIRCPKSKRGLVSFKFIASSLAAALITAPVWLCSYIQVSKSARGISNIAKFICEPISESLKDKLCVIIADAFIFAALLFIIKNPVLKKKSVKYNLILLLLLIIPIFVDPINKIWHFGGYQGFPLRFGYMITFTALELVCCIFEDFHAHNSGSPIYSLISFCILIIFSLISVYVTLNSKKILSYYSEYLGISESFFNTVFAVFMFAFTVSILFLILLRNNLISGNVFFILVSGVVVSELFFNFSAYIGYASNYDEVFKSTMSLENTIDEDSLYRVKAEKKYFHVNMPGALGLNSYAHYTSLNPQDYLFAMKKLGYSSYWMETGSNGGTALTDALLGIKYSIGLESDFNSYQKILDTDADFDIAENLICAPAGIITNTAPEDISELNYTDRIDIQKQLCSRFFKTDSIIEKYDYSSITNGSFSCEDNIYTITAEAPDESRCRMFYSMKIEGNKVLYLDLFDKLGNNVTEPYYNSVMVTVNGMTINESYPDKKCSGFLELGEFNNENVDITLSFLKDVSVKSFGIFGIDTEKLKNQINNLDTYEPDFYHNKIIVDCFAEKDKYLYLSVPWDSGFTAYLNGNKTELLKVNDCFCAVKLNAGENHLKMVFYPTGLKLSLILMAAGIILTVFISLKGKKIFYSIKGGAFSVILLYAAFIAAVIIVYIIPTVIYFAVNIYIKFTA